MGRDLEQLSRNELIGELLSLQAALSNRTERTAAEEYIHRQNATLERRVQVRTAELEQAIAHLKEEIHQRRQVELALQETHRRKDDFLAMLGHELRNPLMPIRNAAEVIRLMGRDQPQLREMASIILRQTSHLKQLVDDLLDVSRIMRDKITLREGTLDLAALVRDVTADFADQYQAAGVSLTSEIPEAPLWIKGDLTRLAQVVGNLIHNAIKFTDQGGHIHVALRHDASLERAELSVRDTGIGIAPEMLPQLFDVFSQADRSLVRSRGGLGLGLALVRGLVELHGGEVTVASPGLGRGTEFTIHLPLAKPPSQTAGVQAAQVRSPRRRVLIVEDQPDTLQTMKLLLESLGHEVHAASNGEEGIHVARQTHPDVIFSDIGLPGMDGYALAREIRNDPQMQSVYLVAMTGYGQKSDQHRAQEAGFDRHLTKPIAFHELEGVLALLTK